MRSRALVRTVMAPNNVPTAPMPGVAQRIIANRPSPDVVKSIANRIATRGTTAHSTIPKKRSRLSNLPTKRALRASGAASRPTYADSSRSRCQLRDKASTVANATQPMYGMNSMPATRSRCLKLTSVPTSVASLAGSPTLTLRVAAARSSTTC